VTRVSLVAVLASSIAAVVEIVVTSVAVVASCPVVAAVFA